MPTEAVPDTDTDNVMVLAAPVEQQHDCWQTVGQAVHFHL